MAEISHFLRGTVEMDSPIGRALTHSVDIIKHGEA